MRFEYVLLFLLSILPLLYKLWYWQYVFREQRNSVREFWKYFFSREGRESCSHFWTILELPILCMGVLPILNAPFEYLFYGMFFYFLVIYNIFVWGKILRKKIHFPRKNAEMLLSIALITCSSTIVFLFPISVYVFISYILLSIPVIFSISLSVLARKRSL